MEGLCGKEKRCLTSLQMMQPSQPRYRTCDQKTFWWLQPQPPSDWYPDQELPRRNQSTHRIMTEKLLFLSHCFAMVGFANLDSWNRKEELGLVFWNTEFEVSTCHESRDILQLAKHSIEALSESLYPWAQIVHQPLGIQNPVNTALNLMNPQFDGAPGDTKEDLCYDAGEQAQRAVGNQKSILMPWQGRRVKGAETIFLEEDWFSQFWRTDTWSQAWMLPKEIKM